MRLTRTKRLGALAIVGMLAVALFAVVPAASAVTDDFDAANRGGYMIVSLDSQGVAQYMTKTNGRYDPDSPAFANYLRRLDKEHARFRANLAERAPDARIVSEYFVTANAVAIRLNGTSRLTIKQMPGVSKVHKVGVYRPAMDQSVDLIGAPEVWADLGGAENAGAGIDVGVIDSGIDPTHPFFWCKDVTFGGVYHAGRGIQPGIPSASALAGPHYSPVPGGYFYFSSSHGTHVAGTIAGCETTVSDGSVWDGTTLSGVAPGANLHDYNVFPAIGAGFVAFGGSAFSHDIADAIEDAVRDDMEVINMSLGGTVQGPNDFLAQVANGAVDAGVVVVTSAGNEGPGAYTVGSPGSAANVIAVAASTNTRGMNVLVNAGAAVYDATPGEFPDFDGTPSTIADWSGSDNEACGAAGVGDHTGEIVIVARGSCTFSQKAENVKTAGGAGMIVYTYPGEEPIGMARSAGFDDYIPAVMVTRADGEALEAAAPIAGGFVTPPTIVGATADELADFSSRGPAPFTNIVKPEITAPGVNILSSTIGFDLFNVNPTTHGWELYNGTSMASPHVAGAAAVLLGANPGWSPSMVKSAFVTTGVDLGLTVWEQGGGLLSMPAAHGAGVFFEPATASFGIMKGNKRANRDRSIEISTDACTVAGVTGDYVDAEIVDTTLTVEFRGRRDAPTGFYDGVVAIECGLDSYNIPWGAVVRR